MLESNKLSASLERLCARQNLGMKFGLDVERMLLDRMGAPERAYGVIHVAGTNGKGSVCAMLDSILRAAGFKVGLYTSPHLQRFNERISVNGEQITDDELGDIFEKTEPLVALVAAETGREPTFFECTTAMAFEYFRSRGIQIAVLETGLGGRLDATNVVTPLVSVITRISVEHTSYLGKDIRDIAGEKCGIIKPHRPVVCGATDEQALAIVRQTAKEKQCILVEADKSVTVSAISSELDFQKLSVETNNASYGTIRLPLAGKHQIENLATTIATIDVLSAMCGMNVEEAAVKTGVSNVNWPGRLQMLSVNPLVILDGAHNPGAGEALASSIHQICKDKPVGLVVGMCSDKDAANFLKSFSRIVTNLWAVPIRSERCMATSQIAAIGAGMGWNVKESQLPSALAEAERWAVEKGGVVCICGSLFMVGEALGMKR